MLTATKLASKLVAHADSSDRVSKLECRDSMLKITTSDGRYTTLYSWVPMEGEFEALVDTSHFAKVIGQLKDAALSRDGKKLKITSGKRNIAVDVETQAFPGYRQPVVAGVSFNREALLKALEFCASAMGTDKYKEHLHVMQVQVQDGVLTLAATDEYRLHRNVVCPEDQDFTALPDTVLLLQDESVAMLLNLLKLVKTPSVTLGTDRQTTPGMPGTERSLVVQAGLHTLQLRENDDVAFPAYEHVIQPLASATYVAKVNSKALTTALTLCQSVTDAKELRLAFDATLTVSAVGGYGNKEVSETIDIVRESGEACSIPVNGSYVKDALAGLGQEAVVYYMHDNFDPIRLSDPNNPDYLALIMLVRE